MRTKSIVAIGCVAFVMALFVFIGSRASAAEPTAGISPAYLRCEYKVNPSAVDAPAPRLSWIVTGEGRGLRQTAYRILAASSAAKLAAGQSDRWDSGKVPSDETAFIAWGGAALPPRSQVFWKVMVWDQDGKESPWSETAFFGTGHPASDWKAEWIGYDVPLDPVQSMIWAASPTLTLALFKAKVYRPAPYLRKNFTAGKPVRRATVYATALGLFELWLNGERVGRDYFTPGFSDYNKRLYYLAYDVTPLVKPGPNAIGAILADGWYAGNVFSRGQKWFGSDLRLRAELHLEYADGTEATVQTDDSWRGSEGPIREADLQAGEAYDARRETDWSSPGFDDGKWHEVDLGAEIAPAVFEAYPGIPVRPTQEIEPLTVSEPKPGAGCTDG